MNLTNQIIKNIVKHIDGYKGFMNVLDRFSIPHNKKIVDLDAKLDRILAEIFTTTKETK